MTFWTYILRCNDGSYYIGHTDNLERRIGQHHSGQIAGHTKHRRPLTLEWCEGFSTRLEALEAERRIKGWGKQKKGALISGDWTLLQLLARNWQDAGCPSTSSGRTEVVATTTIRPEPFGVAQHTLVEGHSTPQSEPLATIIPYPDPQERTP